MGGSGDESDEHHGDDRFSLGVLGLCPRNIAVRILRIHTTTERSRPASTTLEHVAGSCRRGCGVSGIMGGTYQRASGADGVLWEVGCGW